MLTKSDLEQIKNYLALYGKKDSQLEAVPVNLDYPEVTFEANDYLSVVKDNKNKTIKIKDLEKVFLLTFLTDEDFREALKGKIPEEMLENACVTTEKLADGAVTTIKLGDNAVTTAKIATGAITGDKIVNNTIQGSAFAANSITTDKIVDGTVTGDKLADGSIQSVDIKDNTLSGSKFIDNSISGSKIQDNVIESKHLLDNSIPASKIKDGSIESVDIKDGTLDGAKIKDNTIESVKLANNAITTDKIIDNSIITSKIANDAVTEDKIVDNSITTAKIANSSVTTDKIVDGAITEDKLANGAVTTAKLADGLISEIQNITDATPTTGSVKPVQSGGVKTAIDNIAFLTNEKIKEVGIDNEPTAGSDNLVKSGGVFNSIVNNLTVGGQGKMLSAEQGKVLGNAVFETEYGEEITETFSSTSASYGGNDFPSGNTYSAGTKITVTQLGSGAFYFKKVGGGIEPSTPINALGTYYLTSSCNGITTSKSTSVTLKVQELVLSDTPKTDGLNQRLGVVEEKVENASMKIYANVNGYVTADSGDIGLSSSFRCSEFIPFVENLILKNVYVAVGGGTNVGLCYYDKYCNFIGKYTPASSATQDVSLNFESIKSTYPNIAYIRFSTTVSNNGYCIVPSLSGEIVINQIVDNIIKTNGNFFTIEGYLLKSDGTLYSGQTGKYVTDYIPIDINSPLTIYAYGYSTIYSPIVFYNENKVKVGNITASANGMALYSISPSSIPSTAKYIRCGANAKDVGFILANTLSALITDIYSKITYLENKPITYETDYTETKVIKGCYIYYNTNTGNYTFEYGLGNSAYANCRETNRISVKIGDIAYSNAYNTANIVNIILDSDLNILRQFTFSGGMHQFTESDLEGGGCYIRVSSAPPLSGSEFYIKLKTSFDIASYTEQVSKDIKARPRIPNFSYRGLAPKVFKDKLLNIAANSDTDINILLLGDSMTAQTNTASNVFDDATHLPAGCNRDAITYQLWNRLCTNKPQCDRFDSQRDDTDVFTEIGTWVLSDISKFNKNPDGTTTERGLGEHSSDNCIYHETSITNDYVSFNWDLDKFEHLNLIGCLSAYDGTTEITISCTSGKVEIFDRSQNSWIEANGFTFSQKLSETDPDTSHSGYTACWIRNYPLRMRKANGATGEITITATNTGNGTFYYWGTERYNFNTVRITNIGRAGRKIELLWRNIGREVTLRDVDLIIFQLPLWNEFKEANSTNHGDLFNDIKSSLRGIIGDLANYSTENGAAFSKFQLILNLYHTQSYSWKGNKNIQFYPNGDTTKVPTNVPDYQLQTRILKDIKDYIETNNYDDSIKLANLINELYNFSVANGIEMEDFLSSQNLSNFHPRGFTTDGVHLSNIGHSYYSELISPMLFD